MEHFVDLGQSNEIKSVESSGKYYPRIWIDADKLPEIAKYDVGHECKGEVKLKLVGKEQSDSRNTITLEIHGLAPEKKKDDDGGYNPVMEMMKGAAGIKMEKY